MMIDYEFEPYSAADRASCLALFDDNCPEFFAENERRDYATFLDSSPAGYRVCRVDGQVVAAFGVIDTGVPGRRRLNWILVARRAQRGGIGVAMMREAERVARDAGVHIVDIAASHRSSPFFARFGAHETGRIENGWGPGMHRVDMELPVTAVLFTCAGGSVVKPQLVLVDRADGGHLIVNPPRVVWERSELSRDELIGWSLLVAATGRAMIDTLPQLDGGCINYWEAGNWALNECAEPRGPKEARRHRVVHMHLLGRSPAAVDASWRWGEAPRFPSFSDRLTWAARFEPLTAAECRAVIKRAVDLLTHHYGVRA
jgi:GNAT superfamily N-acetyltransferase